MRMFKKKIDWFNIFIAGVIFLLTLIVVGLAAFGVVYEVSKYRNPQTYQGTITDKYNKKESDEDKFFIVLDDRRVIENSDLLFKKKFNSADIQAKLKIGDKVKVKTVGYRIQWLSFYPVLYEIEKLDKQ